MVNEIQRVVKALLGYGARLPKELMLYVKNMVFLDGAIARLAPDLDLFGEIANISMHFAQTHGERLGRESGSTRTRSRSTSTACAQHRGRLQREPPHLPRAAGAPRAHPAPDARSRRSRPPAKLRQ